MKSNKAWVYIVECADGTLYTGWTTNIKRRLATHNAGRGAKYTRARLPVSLRFAEPHPTRSAALKREAAIKKLNRKEKLKLILFQYPLRGTEGVLDNSLD